MPTVPRVSPAPLPGARFDPSAPAGAFQPPPSVNLSGVEQVGLNLYREHQRLVEEERHKADQIAVQSSSAQLTAWQNKALYDPQTGALNTKGENSFHIPETVHTNYWNTVADITEGLASPEQKQAFQLHAADRWNQVDEQVQRHVAQQRIVYDAQSTDTTIDAETERARQGYQVPGLVDDSIATVRRVAEEFGHRNGLSAATIATQVAKHTSDIRSTVFTQLVNSEQDLAAQAYFAKYHDQFVGKDFEQADRLAAASSVRGASQAAADFITGGASSAGQLTSGNIDLTTRPRVKNADGSISTVRSISIEEDGRTILIPTVSDAGKILTDDEAVAQYHTTGKHLGIFADEKAADAYAQRLHGAQAAMLQGLGNGTVPPPALTLSQALSDASKIADPRIRDATEARVRKTFSDRSADEREQRQAVYSQASALLERTGDYEQIPTTMREKLSPTENSDLQRRADQIKEGTTSTALRAHLINLSSLNDATRASFAALPLSTDPQYRKGLSRTDYDAMLTLQRSVRDQIARRDQSDARRDETAADRVRRKEETTIIRQLDAAAKANAKSAAANIDPFTGKPIKGLAPRQALPMPKLPQWMVDSGRVDQDYGDYLRSHGAGPQLDGPSAPAVAAPARLVPGAPLQTPKNIIGITPAGRP